MHRHRSVEGRNGSRAQAALLIDKRIVEVRRPSLVYPALPCPRVDSTKSFTVVGVLAWFRPAPLLRRPPSTASCHKTFITSIRLRNSWRGWHAILQNYTVIYNKYYILIYLSRQYWRGEDRRSLASARTISAGPRRCGRGKAIAARYAFDGVLSVTMMWYRRWHPLGHEPPQVNVACRAPRRKPTFAFYR